MKDELRVNLLRKLERGEELFPGIVGFEEAVVPGLEREAALAGAPDTAENRFRVPRILDEEV